MIVGLSRSRRWPAPRAGRSHAPAGTGSTSRARPLAATSRLERAQTAAVVQLKRAIPSAQVSRRYQVVLNGLAVELPAGGWSISPASRSSTGSTRACGSGWRSTRAQPSSALLRSPRPPAPAAGREDRGHRRRCRPEPSLLRLDRLHLSTRVPERRAALDDARVIVARAFRARLRTPRPASGRSRRVVPRHPCGGHRGRQVGHDLAGRAHAPADGEPLGCRLACLHQQLPRLHGSHAGRARWQHPRARSGLRSCGA